MWKPNFVVPEHRSRARIVWATLLTCITAYSIWQVWKIFDGLRNPSTSLEVTNDAYEFPFVLVCFFEQLGCGYTERNDLCALGALELSEVFLDNEEKEGIVTASTWSDYCVGYDLGKLDLGGSESGNGDPFVEVYTWWTVTDRSSDEGSYYNTVAIYMADEEPTEENLTFLYVPYTRYLPNDDLLDYAVAELTIGKTTKEDLRGDVTTTFPPLILSRTELTIAPSNGSTSSDTTTTDPDIVYGQLALGLRRGSFSRTTIKELSPLDVGTFLGNIGGFWELLVVFWGLFFIATRVDREPKLKARDFVKSIRTGTDIVTRRRSLSVDSASAARLEERPDWDSARGGGHPNDVAAVAGASLGSASTSSGSAAAGGVPMVPPAGANNGADGAARPASNSSVGNGAQAAPPNRRPAKMSASSRQTNVLSSSHRRPAVQDLPQRGQSFTATHPEVTHPLSPAMMP